MKNRDRPAAVLLRRPKAKPCDDFWHTLRIGLPIALLLFAILPFVL